MRAVVARLERVAGRQDGGRIVTGELDGSLVCGNGVSGAAGAFLGGDGQAERSTRGGRSRRSDQEGRRYGDRGHREALLSLRSGVPVDVAGLVGIDLAGAGTDEGDDAGGDRADGAGGGIDGESDGQTRCRSCGRGVRGATGLGGHRSARGEADRLSALGNGEALLDLSRSVPVAVARLIGIDLAGADTDEGDNTGGDRADGAGGAVDGEGDGQTRCRGCGRGVCRAGDLGGHRSTGGEADRLITCTHREALLDLRSRVPVAVAGLVGVDLAGAGTDEGDHTGGDRADSTRGAIDRESDGQTRCGSGSCGICRATDLCGHWSRGVEADRLIARTD